MLNCCVVHAHHPFGCSLFKRWCLDQRRKRTNGNLRFVGTLLSRSPCESCGVDTQKIRTSETLKTPEKERLEPENVPPWKRRNIYQLHQFFGVPAVSFSGCSFFAARVLMFLLLKVETIRFHQISWNSPCLLREDGSV